MSDNHEQSATGSILNMISSASFRFEKETLAHKNTRHKYEGQLTPFYLRWCYGMNNKIPALNLSSFNRKVIFYAAGHTGILYDYENGDMKLLQGHKNVITNITADNVGRWVVTSDSGEDNVVIVWDSFTCIPVRTLFNCHSEYKPQVIGFSKHSKYLITVGNEPNPIIKFWRWTLGNDTPDAVYESNHNLGNAKSAHFNTNCFEQFIVTFEKGVIFLEWCQTLSAANARELSAHIPKLTTKGKFTLTDSTYITRSHNVVSSTSHGHILVWSNTIFTKPFLENDKMNNNKHYIKMISVSKHCINLIKDVDGVIAIGDSDGNIQFFDEEIKLLFWLQKYKFDSIVSLSFNPTIGSDSAVESFDENSDGDENLPDIGEFEEISNNEPEDLELINSGVGESLQISSMPKTPSDATLERKRFVINNFIVSTAGGVLVVYHFLENVVEYLIESSEAPINALVAHPIYNRIIAGNAVGRLTLYDVQTHTILASYTLFELQKQQDVKVRTVVRISSLQISEMGEHLACGSESGQLWILDPSTLQPVLNEPMGESECSIEKLCFSRDCFFMAYYDVSSKVCVFKYDPDNATWLKFGKIRTHYKSINDIFFGDANQLYTFGEDRLLVEYVIEESDLNVKSSMRIEQTAIPLCSTWSPESSGHQFIMASDNQFKFKFYKPSSGMTYGTILAPNFGGSPIQHMKILKSEVHTYILFCNQNMIGIQLFPPDGNPYKFVGMIGHPIKLLDICISSDGEYLFTIGKDDPCIYQWMINIKSVDRMARLGGNDLDPYYCLFDGGQDGWLFNEMKDIFYYMQILRQGENTSAPRVVSTKISINQISDLMCACGFYPTEFEIENMIVEAKHKSYLSSTEENNSEIEFDDFVKLYINHKPAFGLSGQTLQESFLILTSPKESMTKNEFLNALCIDGECLTPKVIIKYLDTLLHHDESKLGRKSVDFTDANSLELLPDEITFNFLLEEILGVDENKSVTLDEIMVPSETVLERRGTNASQILKEKTKSIIEENKDNIE